MGSLYESTVATAEYIEAGKSDQKCTMSLCLEYGIATISKIN
jgi:hypothetical protein